MMIAARGGGEGKEKGDEDAKKMAAVAVAIARWRRSAAVLVGCVSTWAFASMYPPQWCLPFLIGGGPMISQRRLLSPVQASAVTGLLASLLVTTTSTTQTTNTKNTQQQQQQKNGPALAAAMFCGSFAGMSSRVLTTMMDGSGAGTLAVAGQMGTIAALCYYVFDAWQIGVGVGGRLGVVGVLANVIIGTLRGWPDCRAEMVVADTVQRLGGLRMTMALAALPALALATRWQESSTSVGAGAGAVGGGDSSVERRCSKLQKRSKTAVKTMMLGLLLVFSSGAVRTVTDLGSWAATWTTIYTSAMIILTATAAAGPDHVVRAAALVGLVAGTVLPARLGAASYIGAFIGMTRRPPLSPPQRRFLSGSVAQASFLAALLQGGGVCTGLGGRLGALAFVSVLFSLY
jgi:hypothetical protein